MEGLYVLDAAHNVVPCEDAAEWGRFMSLVDLRRVGEDEVNGQRVSTVFLGIDHGREGGPPALFETMIFGGPDDGWQARCATWAEAEAGHEAVVNVLKLRGSEQ